MYLYFSRKKSKIDGDTFIIIQSYIKLIFNVIILKAVF